MTTSGVRFPDPPRFSDTDTQEEIIRYLNELSRVLQDFDLLLYSDKDKNLFQTARNRPIVEVSTDYTAGINQSVILADCSAADVAVTLPTALDSQGIFYDIKKIDTDLGTTVCVVGSGPEFPITLNGGDRPSVTLYSDGTNYWII